ncbi:MAG: hypothetical protein AB1416_06395 [Actinomycetota bacterium]
MSPAASRPRLASRVLTRLLYRADGSLSGVKVTAIAAAAVILFTAISIPVILAIGVDSTTGIAMWVVVLLVTVKLPALGIFWWMLSRHVETPGQEALTSREIQALIERLDGEALRASRRPDAADELRRLLGDAWYVADRAADADKASAVACALRIQELAARGGRVGYS